MYLTVDERICFEHIRMALVLVWGFAFFQNVTKRSEHIIIPVAIHKPLPTDKRHIALVHTKLTGLL